MRICGDLLKRKTFQVWKIQEKEKWNISKFATIFAHKQVLACSCVKTNILTPCFLLKCFYRPSKIFLSVLKWKHCNINWKTGRRFVHVNCKRKIRWKIPCFGGSQSKYRHKNGYKYSQELIGRRQQYLSVQANGSTVEQQMALPAKTPTQNIAKNIMLFKNTTRDMNFFILLVDSVAIVKYQKLIGKNSLENIFLYENS